MKYDVFISYSRKDYIDENKQVIPNNVISKLKELFKANYITYWIDEDGIYSGDMFANVIAQNIKASTLLLFVSSEHSNKSKWTCKEIALADKYGKAVIPLRIDNYPYNDSLDFLLSDVDYTDYQSNPSLAMSRILMAIQNQLIKEEPERQEWKNQLTNVCREIDEENEKLTDAENKVFEYEKTIESYRNLIDNYKVKIVGLRQKELDLKRSLGLIVQEIHFSPKETISKESTDSIVPVNNVHWTIKGLYMLAALVALALACFCIYEGVKLGYTSAITTMLAFTFASLMAIVGSVRVLKTFRDGLVWLLASVLGMNVLEFVTLIWTKGSGLVHPSAYYGCSRVWMIVCSLAACLVLALPMFVPKNGVNLWSQMKTPTLSLKNDKLRLAFVILTVLMAFSMAYNRLWHFI